MRGPGAAPAGGVTTRERAMLMMLVGVAVVVPVSLMIAVAILKGAVSMTNQFAGGREPKDGDFEFTGRSWNPRLRTRSGMLIPEPTGGQAAMLVVCVGVLTFLIQLAAAFAAQGFILSSNSAAGFTKLVGQTTGVTILVMSSPVCFFVRAWAYRGALPTTFAKACGVAAFELVIAALLGAIVFAALVAVGYAAMPIK